jgi:hypothetical protein
MFKRTTAALVAALVALAGAPASTSLAQTDPDPLPAARTVDVDPITVTDTDGGVRITIAADAADATRMAQVHVGDVLLPGKRIVVLRDGARAAQAADTNDIQTLSASAAAQATSAAYAGQIESASVTVARSAEGELLPERTRPADTRLPESPVTILEEGIFQGQRLAVIAITPVFGQGGAARFATQLDVTLPGTRLVEDVTTLLAPFDSPESAGQLSAAAQAASAATCDAIKPRQNPQASKFGWKIRVARGGMQQVTAAALAAAGTPSGVGPLTLANLRVQSFRNNPNPIAIRRFDTNGNGVFDGADAVRFYAPDPGDRWNATDTYWLTFEAGAGSPDMAVLNAPGATGGATTTALERGRYINNKWYEQTLAGVDGDHWFAARLRPRPLSLPNPVPPEIRSQYIWSVSSTTVLPAASGSTIVTLNGSLGRDGTRSFTFSSSGSTATTNVSGVGTFTATFTLASIGGPSELEFLPGVNEFAFPDRISWERPVSLSFGGNGAAFLIRGAAAIHQASGTPAQGNDRLYDVTDPNNPQLVLLNSSEQFTHAGGDRSYVMAGTGTLFSSGEAQGPAASAYTPFRLDAPFTFSALYLAPVTFTSLLQPLINLRNAQGHSTGALGIEAIYDWWGFGQVSPDAIRTFLRYASACWTVKPVAVTFVGDGSSDPMDYNSYGSTNVNLVPPYMAKVDPYRSSFPEIAEAACDACYAQLDGDDPLSDRLPDLMYGRLPAKSAAEVTSLVNKIVSYENTALGAGSLAWRNRIAYLADNYRLTVAEGSGFDPAGNFSGLSETSITQQPKNLQIQRVYFDPTNAQGNPTVENQLAQAAYAASKAAFDAGAGIINYMGHANIGQVAVTTLDGNPNYLLGFLDPDSMKNAGRLPIVLQMTCLTSAFETPVQYYGTVLDERLLLATDGGGNGIGAAAVWGSTGLGVSYGHESLQRGFYKTLWGAGARRMQTPLGKAAAGGYLELFTQTQGTGTADDSLRTYVVLGDALLRVRVGPATLFTPFTRK